MELVNFLKGCFGEELNGQHYVQGKSLLMMVDLLERNDPFVGSKIDIIEEINEIDNPKVVVKDNSIMIEGSITKPELICVKYIPGIRFNDNVRLYGVNLMKTTSGEEVLSFRCTPESITIPQ